MPMVIFFFSIKKESRIIFDSQIFCDSSNYILVTRNCTEGAITCRVALFERNPSGSTMPGLQAAWRGTRLSGTLMSAVIFASVMAK